MSTTREIITIQLGNYANYVGTHWWNIQESAFNYNPSSLEKSEMNHDVLFREGENQRGLVTYTPRMVLLDLTGSLGHMSMEGELYEDPAKAELLAGDQTVIQSHSGWNSAPVEVIRTEKEAEKHDYIKVDILSVILIILFLLTAIFCSISGLGQKQLHQRPVQVSIP